MIHSLPMPPRDAENDFQLVRSTRRLRANLLLTTLESDVFTAYGNYRSDLSVGVLIPMGYAVDADESRRTLIGNFKHVAPGKVLQNLYSDIFAVSDTTHGQCPLCGLSPATTIDHYFPKTLYPEYSILIDNLIPLCPSCNNLKSDTCRLQNPSSGYFHSYLDVEPATPVLLAHVVCNSAIDVQFSARQPNNDADLVALAYVNQFKQLKLGKKYRAVTVGELQFEFDNLDDNFRQGGAIGLKQSLLRRAETSKITYGANHWRAALYTSLAQSEDFCNEGYKVIERKNLGGSEGI